MPGGWSENQLRALRGHHAPARALGHSGPQQRTTRAPGGEEGGETGPPGPPGPPGSADLGNGHIEDWVIVTGTTQTMSPRTGYIPTSASLTTFTLPVTCDQTEVMAVVGSGTGKWIIAQNAGQTIFLSRRQTTVGTGGSLAAKHAKDAVYLRCVTDDTTFAAAFEV